MGADRRWAVAALTAVLVLPAGCGDRGRTVTGAVRLVVAAPADGQTVRADHVVVSGRVVPASARVLVDGRLASRNGDRFEAGVPLPEGTIVVDVLAEADRRRPALTAVRVHRPVTIGMPDVEGETVGDARRALAAAGLQVKLRRSGGLFDDLLPGELRVCGSDPPAGSTVELPATVTLTVAHSC